LVALAVVSVATFLPPWLAARHVAAAQSSWRADPDAAYRSLERARALNPLSDNPDVVAGAIASRRRDDARARIAFRRALERNPSNWYAAMELGLLESVAGRRALALGHLARAFELNPLEGLIEVLSDRIRKGERIHPSSLDQMFLDEAGDLAT
jgi:tetratricopeptide (TPR) repeat protein